MAVLGDDIPSFDPKYASESYPHEIRCDSFAALESETGATVTVVDAAGGSALSIGTVVWNHSKRIAQVVIGGGSGDTEYLLKVEITTIPSGYVRKGYVRLPVAPSPSA